MKKTNFVLPSFIAKSGTAFFCLFLFLFISVSSVSAQTINIPQLKPVALAIDALRTKMHEKEQIWKSGGANDPQQKLVIDLYMQMIDALETRVDPNMDTKAVLLSNLNLQTNSAYVVMRNGREIDMDATITNVLAKSEYLDLLQTLKI